MSESALKDPLLSQDETEEDNSDTQLMLEYKPSLIILGCIGFIDSVEYSLIMPSLYVYLQDLVGSKMSNNQLNEWYGLILSSFAISGMIFYPIIGIAADRFGYKLTFIVTTWLGNTIYNLY
jgi:MFS family permease